MSRLQIAKLGFIAASALAGCLSGPRTLVDPPPEIVRFVEEGDENFDLAVSNQSGSRDSVDMEISIDAKPVVQGEFKHGYGHRLTRYLLQLSPGEHVLRAKTSAGEAELEVRFSTEEGTQRYAAIDYFYSPGGKLGVPIEPHFEWIIRDEPIPIR